MKKRNEDTPLSREETGIRIRYYSSVQARDVEWFWYSYIPYGKITIVQGNPGDGKTTFVLNIAALFSNNRPTPESNRLASRELEINREQR
jgi:hypothetical protein